MRIGKVLQSLHLIKIIEQISSITKEREGAVFIAFDQISEFISNICVICTTVIFDSCEQHIHQSPHSEQNVWFAVVCEGRSSNVAVTDCLFITTVWL